MMDQLAKLTKQEQEILFTAPILLSVLAASGDHEIDKKEKAEAAKLIHLKTFTAESALIPYYKEVEKNFNACFEEVTKRYAPFDHIKRQALKEEINVLQTVFEKLDKDFASILNKSLASYAEHVRKANANFLEGFIFPIPINGLTN